MEEERAERQRWNQREQQKIMDSVKGTWYVNSSSVCWNGSKREQPSLTNLASLSCPLILSVYLLLCIRTMMSFFVSIIGLARIRRRAMAIQQREGGGDHEQAEQDNDQEVSLSV